MQTDLPGKDLLMTLPAEDRRNFASITVSISLKNFFDSIPNVVLMPYLYDIGASFTLLGLFRAIPSAVGLFSSRLWGVLSDYFSRRKPFIVLSFLLSIPFSLAYAFKADSPADFLVIRAVHSLFSLGAGIVPATIASASTQLGKAFGDYAFATSLAGTSGGMLGGWFVERHGIRAAFLLSIFGSLSSSTIFLLTYREEGQEARSVSPKRVLLKTISFDLAPKAWHLTFLAVLTALRSSFFGLPAVMKMYVLLGRSMAGYTTILSLAGLTSILTSPLYGRAVDKLGAKESAKLSLLAYSIYLPLMALINNPVMFAILWAIPIGNLEYTALMSLKVMVSNPSGMAADISTMEGLASLSLAVGNVMAGAVVDLLGKTSSILMATVFDIMALLLLLGLDFKESGQSKLGRSGNA